MQIPLKTVMIGEDLLVLTSRSCTASAFFRGHPSPDEWQRVSGDTAVCAQEQTPFSVNWPHQIKEALQ